MNRMQKETGIGDKLIKIFETKIKYLGLQLNNVKNKLDVEDQDLTCLSFDLEKIDDSIEYTMKDLELIKERKNIKSTDENNFSFFNESKL